MICSSVLQHTDQCHCNVTDRSSTILPFHAPSAAVTQLAGAPPETLLQAGRNSDDIAPAGVSLVMVGKDLRFGNLHVHNATSLSALVLAVGP